MHVVELNLARNCLKYLIRTYGINEMFVPYYTCETVWNAVREENCAVKFYHIDKNFLPIAEFPEKSYILYTNYYGLCTENCKILTTKYKNLIVDNSHAFFAPHTGLADFNSLRKFFDVTNGALLFTENPSNEVFEPDTLILPPAKFNRNYERFLQNELVLNKENTIKTISLNTKNILQNINLEQEKANRRAWFLKYNKIFGSDNQIKLPLKKTDVPYCYPFCPKIETFNGYAEIFKKNNIKLLKLWKNFPENFDEAWLNNTAALPLDDTQTMQKITKIFE